MVPPVGVGASSRGAFRLWVSGVAPDFPGSSRSTCGDAGVAAATWGQPRTRRRRSSRMSPGFSVFSVTMRSIFPDSRPVDWWLSSWSRPTRRPIRRLVLASTTAYPDGAAHLKGSAKYERRLVALQELDGGPSDVGVWLVGFGVLWCSAAPGLSAAGDTQ